MSLSPEVSLQTPFGPSRCPSAGPVVPPSVPQGSPRTSHPPSCPSRVPRVPRMCPPNISPWLDGVPNFVPQRDRKSLLVSLPVCVPPMCPSKCQSIFSLIRAFEGLHPCYYHLTAQVYIIIQLHYQSTEHCTAHSTAIQLFIFLCNSNTTAQYYHSTVLLIQLPILFCYNSNSNAILQVFLVLWFHSSANLLGIWGLRELEKVVLM